MMQENDWLALFEIATKKQIRVFIDINEVKETKDLLYRMSSQRIDEKSIRIGMIIC